MKSILNTIKPNNVGLKKIHLNKILHDKNNVIIATDENPVIMIRQIENTYHLSDIFRKQIYLVDDYYYDFISNMKKNENQNIYPLKFFNEQPESAIFLNFNNNFEISTFLENYSETIFYDIKNRGNFIIEPPPENYSEVLNIFSKMINYKIPVWKFDLLKLKNKDIKIQKIKLIFDIQNSSNEKSVEVLLKNLQQYDNIEIYLIWRTGSIDFDYSHIDIDNFMQFYTAILNSDIFFTDDKELIKLLNILNVQSVFLGKNFELASQSFNPKNIFDIKNFIFSKLNE